MMGKIGSWDTGRMEYWTNGMMGKIEGLRIILIP